MNFENYHFFQWESKNAPKRKLATCQLQKNISEFKNINFITLLNKIHEWI